jgi:TPR repeat protein
MEVPMLNRIALIPLILMMVALTGCQQRPKSVVDATAAKRIDALKKQAESGDVNAQFTLANTYYFGEVVPQDFGQADSQAAIWLRKAADQGNPFAQCLLGDMYYSGEGIGQDKAQGIALLQKAAAQGNTIAQKDLVEVQKQEQEVNARALSNTPTISSQLHSYWSTTVRVDTDMDSFWLPDEERTCKTYPDAKGRVAVVACNESGSHRDHNIPVTFWGDLDRNAISDWKCRREKDTFKDEFVCRAIN